MCNPSLHIISLIFLVLVGQYGGFALIKNHATDSSLNWVWSQKAGPMAKQYVK